MGTLNTPDTSRFTGVENELQKEAQKKSPTQESGTNTANIATETMYNPDVKQASIEELVEKANLLSTANNNINSSLNDPNATPEEVALLKDFQSNKLPTLSNLEISNLNQKCKIQVAGP